MNVAYLMYEAERETANDRRPSSILGSFPATGYDIDELIREVDAALTSPEDSASAPFAPRRGHLHETSKLQDRLGVVVHL